MGKKPDELETESDFCKRYEELAGLNTERFSSQSSKEIKTGRPLRLKDDDYTRDKLHYLAAVGFTQQEAADALNVSLRTFTRALAKFEGLRRTWERGQAFGTGALRAKQFRVAMEGNTRMLIWLGKQRLGQVDHPENAYPRLRPIKEMSDEELYFLLDELNKLYQEMAAEDELSA